MGIFTLSNKNNLNKLKYYGFAELIIRSMPHTHMGENKCLRFYSGENTLTIVAVLVDEEMLVRL